jgi:hypothetical protein
MRVRSILRISSHFTSPICLIIVAWVLVLLTTALYVRRFQTSLYKPLVPFTSVTVRSNTAHPVRHHQPSASNMEKQKLPLIYQPSAKATILRALLLFYPNDQESDFLCEFRWFYRSWTEMMANESALWRTDVIVYASEYAPVFKNLGCLYEQVRTTSEERPQCRVFSYIRIKDRIAKHEPSSKYQTIDKQRSQTVYEHLRSYGYIDSINTVFEFNASFLVYDFILRTDMDCFLTDDFALYVPYNRSVLVGRGGYSTDFNSRRLKRIARDMNWTYADKNSLGSTW